MMIDFAGQDSMLGFQAVIATMVLAMPRRSALPNTGHRNRVVPYLH